MSMLLQGIINCFSGITFPLMIFGVAVGIIFGAIPGLNASIAIALFLPLTYTMNPITAFAFLVALHIGGVSGGLVSACLINIPGTSSSVATTFDGSPMVKAGYGRKALGTGTVFSFFGTIFGVLCLIGFAPLLAKFALKFGVYEYLAIAIFSLSLISVLAGKDMVKGLLAGLIGILVAMVGVAPVDGFARFTFGNHALDGGFSLVPTLVGMFAIPEIVKSAQGKNNATVISLSKGEHSRGFGFSLKEMFAQTKNFLLSAAIGTGIGILPGIGGGTSNILAYATCKRVSKHPEKYGTGIMDGIVASESANNATIGGAFIPLLALGIPGDVITAVLLGAFTINGIAPGPQIFETHTVLVYTIFGALLVANLIMLILEYFGINVFVKILKIPQHILMPFIMVLCCVGAYSVSNNIFDVYTLLGFGLLGLILQKFEFPRPPIVLGFVLAEMFEKNLRRTIQFSKGKISVFLTRPIALVFLVLTILILLVTVISQVRGRKEKFDDDV